MNRQSRRGWTLRQSLVILGIAFGLILAGCGPGEVNLDKYKGPNKPPKRQIEQKDKRLLRKYFLDETSFERSIPNVTEYFMRFPDKDREPKLMRKEIDLNLDGTPDIIRYYEPNGRLVKSKEDTDFDKNIDLVNHYSEDEQLAYQEVLGEEGDVQLTRYYRNESLESIEKDADGDGQTDQWETYEEGELLRIGRDTNGDGNPDEWMEP